MNQKDYKVAATVTVYRAAEMTDKGRKSVCDWLRKVARTVERTPEVLGSKLIARYWFRPTNRKPSKEPR